METTKDGQYHILGLEEFEGREQEKLQRIRDGQIFYREPGTGKISDPSLKRAWQTRVKKEAEALTLAEKLILLGKERKVTVPFGGLDIEFYEPTKAELNKLMTWAVKAGEGSNMVKPEFWGELYRILGLLAVDPSINVEFFEEGDFPASLIIALNNGLITSAIRGSEEYEAGANFRQNGGR